MAMVKQMHDTRNMQKIRNKRNLGNFAERQAMQIIHAIDDCDDLPILWSFKATDEQSAAVVERLRQCGYMAESFPTEYPGFTIFELIITSRAHEKRPRQSNSIVARQQARECSIS